VPLRRQACEEALERGAQDGVLEVGVGGGGLFEHQAGDGRDDQARVGLGVVGAGRPQAGLGQPQVGGLEALDLTAQ
jgi:hypothetical protein